MRNLILAFAVVSLMYASCAANKSTESSEEIPMMESIDSVPAPIIMARDYAGKYSFGTHPDSGATGVIQLYPLSDTSLLFYLDVNRGAPSYNMGAMLGEINVHNGTAIYSLKEGDYIDCQLNISFNADTLSITSPDGKSACGFGYGVYPDGKYLLQSHVLPKFFLTGEGDSIFFDGLTMEKYDKRFE